MSDLLSSLKLQTFEIFAYVFPGVLLSAALLNIVFEMSFAKLSTNFIYIVIVGFIVGIILHSLFGWLEGLMWLPYNFFKEKDENGKGVKHPKSVTGILALKYRSLVFGAEENGNINRLAKEKIKESFGLDNPSSLDQLYIKENQFIQNQKVSEFYAHLSYNKIFNSSTAVALFIIAIAIAGKAVNSDFKILVSTNTQYNWDLLAFWCVIASMVACLLLFRRSIFYKNYRNQVLNANIITSTVNKL